MVRTNFKSTEVGLIPIDWEVSKLLDKCILLNGLTYTPANIQEHGVLVLRSSNVQNGKLCFDDNVYVNCHISDEKFVRKNDIIVCVRNGSSALIGKCAIATEDLNATFGAFMALLRGDDNKFIFQLLQEGSIQKKLKNNSGATINQITKKDFESVFIPAPPSDEQKAIAIALSDVDELIENLEKLIEKKKAIKQGTMQELLTGKKRLPGFNGEWKEHTIGKCGYLQKGSINPQTLPDHYFSEYSMPAFDSTHTPSKVQGKTMHSNRTVISGKVLLFNKLNVRQKRIWLIENCENNAVCSAEFLPYSSDTIDLKLLSQILYTDEVTNEFIGMSTGSSNSQKRITPKSFLDYSLFLPTDIEEQKALAEVFSDMDIEIEQLRSKLDKYRLVKQGMMQKLLTGEIRLM